MNIKVLTVPTGNSISASEFTIMEKLQWLLIDVLEPEPPFDLHPEKHNYQHQLLKNPKIIVTPHIGASKVEAQKGISFNLAEQLKKTLIS